MVASKFNNRGQSSFEYIMLVGMVMLFMVGGIGFMYSYSKNSNNDIQLSNIAKAGQDIILTADKVYYIGSDSWETIRINLPENVNGVYVAGANELVIEYESYGGISEDVFFSDINLTAPFLIDGKRYISEFPHSGMNVIRVTSFGSYVNISEVN